MVSSNLIAKALKPRVFSSVKELGQELIKTAMFHKKGQFFVINKPYAVSCLGYKQDHNGIFKDSRKSVKKTEPEDDFILEDKSCNDLTIEKTLPFLNRALDEKNIHFCLGLKKYVSGPVVLPCSSEEFQRIKKSIQFSSTLSTHGYMRYRALTLCLGRPVDDFGTISGSISFIKVGNHLEYIFEEKKVSRQVIHKKNVINCTLNYKVIAWNGEISLIDMSFVKFNRHGPRIMLTHLGAPFLGDFIYWKRFRNIQGKMTEIDLKSQEKFKQNYYYPEKLLETLNISRTDYKDIPLYFHVYESVFPRYLNTKLPTSADLVVMAPPPEHFEAMIRILGFKNEAILAMENTKGDYDESDSDVISKL
ncbi:Pseudouridine synthase, catalytic domain-containing protein [Strongyloides ratti]|uniref:Pseudouridine synthase, catalytic domain-containing protein n=1 Tax=Strongyloides ratti TaxID=34506 RepID=A0A090LHN8_STRRB|nr:Pseudouridine synthase, catalytic domain-containing protein [Strongyloides ratti]CEF69311.1 Pseudouridine synthase, catalytic domain-containing protein [Strongyloides ratti]